MLAYFFIKADISDFIILFTAKNALLMCLAIMLSLSIIFFKAVRWQYMLKRLDIEALGFWHNFRIIGASFFLGSVTPSRIGEFAKVISTDKKANKTAAYAVEAICDIFIVILIPAIFTVSVIFNYLWLSGFILAFAALVFLPMRLAKSRAADKLIVWLFPKQKNALEHKQNVLNSFHSYIRNKNVIIITILLSFIMYMALFVSGYLVLKSFDIEVTFLEAIAGLSLGHLIGILSFIPLGLGTREASSTAFFISQGMSGSAVLSAILAFRLLTMIPVAASYVIYLRWATKNE